ncbi:MAG: M43 family zinc metalloprotease [Bacteroidia bacterium]
MKKNIFLSLISLFAALTSNIVAQEAYLRCASTEAMNKIFDAHPEIKAEHLKRVEEWTANEHNSIIPKSNQQQVVYTIPVVFHIIHQGGAENISDAQVMDAVDVLNQDFRKLNATAANTVSQFQSIAADCEIEFKLAQKDPVGACTNGIDRIASSLTNNADDDSKLNPWPVNKYLNIWVVKTIGSSGVAGYAYFPGTAFPATTDGILILSNYIGSIGTSTPTRSHALTHEVGHYLSLYHTWGGTNDPGVDCGGSDLVNDTPPTEGWTSCNLNGATCGNTIDNVQNFMDYSYCYTMFTAGQKQRMHDALNSPVGNRNNLWTVTNLANTGVSLPDVLCKADFESNNADNTICEGGMIAFNDLSWNGSPTGWSWSFPGGIPSTSSDSAPIILYNTPGTYNVSLTVTRGSESATTTKSNYVIVNSSTATYTNAIYSEGFEGTSIPNTDWKVQNRDPGGNTWSQTSGTAATGSKCVKITNSASYDGYIDELISPSINMTNIAGNSPTLTFKVAHAQKNSSSADKLQIYVSTNCGVSWSLRKTISGASLSTAGVQSSSFTPNASQWATQSVNLNGYASQTNLYFKFKFTSNGGNHIYLDDINISGTTDIENMLASTSNFAIYPNPIENNSLLSFTIINKSKVEIQIYDVVGKLVNTIVNENLREGDYEYNINKQMNLKAGIYFVTLLVDNQKLTKKVIIN